MGWEHKSEAAEKDKQQALEIIIVLWAGVCRAANRFEMAWNANGYQLYCKEVPCLNTLIILGLFPWYEEVWVSYLLPRDNLNLHSCYKEMQESDPKIESYGCCSATILQDDNTFFMTQPFLFCNSLKSSVCLNWFVTFFLSSNTVIEEFIYKSWSIWCAS